MAELGNIQAQLVLLQARCGLLAAQINATAIKKRDNRAVCQSDTCPHLSKKRGVAAGIPLNKLHVALTGKDMPSLLDVYVAVTAPFHQTTGWTKLLNPHLRCCVANTTPIVSLRKQFCSICLVTMLSPTAALEYVCDHVVACRECAVPSGIAGFGTASIYKAFTPLVHIFTYKLLDSSTSFVLGGCANDPQVPVDILGKWIADVGFTYTIKLGNKTHVLHVYFEVDGSGHNTPCQIASGTVAVLNAWFHASTLDKCDCHYP